MKGQGMTTKKNTTNSAAETKEIAKNLAKDILSQKLGSKAVVLALKGNLGAGKTTFIQGFAKGLDIKGKILSPTFSIMKRYKFKGRNFYHIDCYRLKNAKDLEILGFKEMILNPKNIIAIEWSERVKKILPHQAIYLTLAHLKGDRRKLTINQ